MARLYENSGGLRKRHAIAIASAVVVCVLMVLAIGLFSASQQHADTANARQQIKQAVLDSASQCYAIEGSYPSDTAYLEEHYGLQINHDRFIVSYQTIGGNTVPNVEVLVRGNDG